MITQIRVELTDQEREAFNAMYGKKGKATRKTITAWIESLIEITIGDIVSDYEAANEEAAND